MLKLFNRDLKVLILNMFKNLMEKHAQKLQNFIGEVETL